MVLDVSDEKHIAEHFKNKMARSGKASKRQYTKKHTWTWHESVEFVKAIQKKGAHNRWDDVIEHLADVVKMKEIPKKDAVKRYWKKLCNREKSIFFQPYEEQEMEKLPANTATAAIRRAEQLHIEHEQRNKDQHAEMREIIEDILARELEADSNIKETEKQMQERLLKHDTDKKKLRVEKFRVLEKAAKTEMTLRTQHYQNIRRERRELLRARFAETIGLLHSALALETNLLLQKARMPSIPVDIEMEVDDRLDKMKEYRQELDERLDVLREEENNWVEEVMPFENDKKEVNEEVKNKKACENKTADVRDVVDDDDTNNKKD